MACNAKKSNESPSEQQRPPQDESSGVLSNPVAFSSQPSLPSLPSLNFRDQIPPPSLHQCITTLKGHSSYISVLTIHGKSLYSGSSDQDIRLWTSIPLDSPSYQKSPPSFIVAATKSPVKSLAISALCSPADTQGPLPKPLLAQELRSSPAPQEMHLGAPRRRHLRPGSLARRTLLYSVSWDRTLKVWRTSDFKCMESVAGAHHDAINAITMSSDGYIYTGSADTTIKVWRRHAEEKKHSLVATLERHKSAVNALALSGDGSVLYSGACDRSVVVWEGSSGLMEATGALRGHTRAILSLAATVELVCSGSVRVWRRGEDKRYSCLAVLEGHGRPIKSLAMVGVESHMERNNSYLVFSGGMDCDIKVWKLLVPPLEGIR